MAQYCRYCQHFFCGNGEWCEAKEKELTEKYAKSQNRCKEFELNPVDAYGENLHGYRPKKVSTARKNQARMDV